MVHVQGRLSKCFVHLEMTMRDSRRLTQSLVFFEYMNKPNAYSLAQKNEVLYTSCCLLSVTEFILRMFEKMSRLLLGFHFSENQLLLMAIDDKTLWGDSNRKLLCYMELCSQHFQRLYWKLFVELQRQFVTILLVLINISKVSQQCFY